MILVLKRSISEKARNLESLKSINLFNYRWHDLILFKFSGSSQKQPFQNYLPLVFLASSSLFILNTLFPPPHPSCQLGVLCIHTAEKAREAGGSPGQNGWFVSRRRCEIQVIAQWLCPCRNGWGGGWLFEFCKLLKGQTIFQMALFLQHLIQCLVHNGSQKVNVIVGT